MDDLLQLGGNIELSGFRVIDKPSFMIIKKIVGNYARKFSDAHDQFDKLHLNLKPIHANDNRSKYELHAKLVHSGKTMSAEDTDHNIFYVLDKTLKKIENQFQS